MGALAVTTLRRAASPPFAWIPEAIVELSSAFRRCIIPLVVSHTVYLIGYGIILIGAVLGNIGVIDRQPGAILLIWDREIATWITAMIFAGVVGSAVTADLGARKIREELAALDVLGVRRIDTLVVPRIMAMTFAAPLLAVVSLLVVIVVNFFVGPLALGFSHGVYVDNLISNIQTLDILLTLVVKNLVIGFFVGVVACHKGLTCKSGAEGVGRAVNQTVVLTFFGIWLFNSLFNLAYVTVFPNAALIRG
jgi:phospholipid/cholesterol/gamma-HCH transport system permease protein